MTETLRMTDRKVENRKLAILFDVDDTLYDMTQPFEKAYRDVFYDKYPQLDWKPVYVASRKHSDEVFEASQRGEISMDDMYVYRWSKAMDYVFKRYIRIIRKSYL